MPGCRTRERRPARAALVLLLRFPGAAAESARQPNLRGARIRSGVFDRACP